MTKKIPGIDVQSKITRQYQVTLKTLIRNWLGHPKVGDIIEFSQVKNGVLMKLKEVNSID